MKFGKIIGKTLAVLLFSANLSADYNPDVFNKEYSFLPEKFKDYRNRTKKIEGKYGYIHYKLFYIEKYTTNLGGKVIEIHGIINKNGISTPSKNICLYGFDLDGDGGYNPLELWMDFDLDGLNGNEIQGY